MKELLDIIGAMRSMAAVRMQQAAQALDGIRQYDAIIADALAQAVALLPEPAGLVSMPIGKARVLVVFCSEHGFAGAFNDRMLDRAAGELRDGGRLFIVGSRGAALARERGYDVAWATPMATHSHSVPEITRGVAARLYREFSSGETERVDTLFGTYGAGGLVTLEHRTLLPLELAPFAREIVGMPPVCNLPAEDLVEGTIEEYFFAELTRAAMETVASVNGTRLRAMQSAYDNIEEKLTELRLKANVLRQQEITMELLDVVTGAEAMLERGQDG